MNFMKFSINFLFKFSMSHLIHKFKNSLVKNVHFSITETTNAVLDTADNKQSYTKENDERRVEKLQRSLKPTTILVAYR